MTLVLGTAPFWGRWLVREDLIAPADAIFVLGGSRAERWLEAVDLYRAGHSSRIVVSPGIREAAEDELAARGIRIPTDGDLARGAMLQLGIPAASIQILDGHPDNTAQEGDLLRQLVRQSGWRAVIVVTSKYHTRRARFAMRRALEGTGVLVIMRASTHDRSNPARWWRNRRDVRFVVSELQKLIAYGIGVRG